MSDDPMQNEIKTRESEESKNETKATRHLRADNASGRKQKQFISFDSKCF